VNEKPSAILDLEAGTGQYNADLINRIEKVLGVKIPRGRKGGNRRRGKNPAAGGF
jgi:ribosome-binding protein aMBF1 (putative translation factor)